MGIGTDKKIDRFNLEKESELIASQLWTYSKELADAEKELEHLLNKHKVIVADVSYALYKAGKTADGVKVTKDVAVSRTDSATSVVDSLEEITDAKYEVRMAKAAVSAIEFKKSAINNLVKLQLTGYYNQPGHSGKIGDTQDAMHAHLNRED